MNKPSWTSSLASHIFIFSVGRGLSIFIRLPSNQGILYDLGYAPNTEFSPIDFLNENIMPHLSWHTDETNNSHNLAQMVISHPHADHLSEIDSVLESHRFNNPSLLTCPHDRGAGESADFSRIENDDNIALMSSYRRLIGQRNPPLQTFRNSFQGVPNVEYGIYFMNPSRVNELHPKNDHHYVNGLSICLYYRHGNQNILLTGDITPKVFKEAINDDEGSEKRFTSFDNSDSSYNWHSKTSNQPCIGKHLNEVGLNLLVAPHHGLESCFCEDLYNYIEGGKVDLHILSEKRHKSESDGKVDARYSSEVYSHGHNVDVNGTTEFRRKITTVNYDHILIKFQGTNKGPGDVYLRKNAEDLLDLM
jgi:hypothetical protein